VSLAFRLPGSPRPKPLAPRGMKMSNAEPLAVEVADANKLAAVPNHIDGHDTTSSRRLRQRRGWPLEGETVTLSSQAYRPASASGEGEPHGGVEGVKLPPPIRGYKWCPNHLEAIRLNYAGICPVCMVAPGPFLICAESSRPATSTAAAWHAYEPPHPRCSYCPEHRCTKCPKGWTFGVCEYDTVVPLPAQIPRQNVVLGTAESRRAEIVWPCPAKRCAAPSVLYETGSYYGLDGKRDVVWDEATCVNGHSHLARRLAPEDVEPEHSVAQRAPVPPEASAMFENVVTTRYAELRKIAERALDGGKIPGDEDCVQQAIAALLRKGSYATCADEGEMFGQLVVTVQNRAKAIIKRWAKDKTRYRPLAVEYARPWHRADGDKEIDSEADHGPSGDDNRVVSEVLRPRPVEQTRDLWIDAKWALFEEAVPLDAQAVFVGEATRKERIGRFKPRIRHLQTTIFDKNMLEHRQRLAKRLVATARPPA
jgi:hypothetical protein